MGRAEPTVLGKEAQKSKAALRSGDTFEVKGGPISGNIFDVTLVEG